MRLKSFIFFIVFSQVLNCSQAQNNVTVSTVDNYNDWGWDNVHVAKNKFISLAIVPQAAGRILKYDLGESKSLWLKPDMMGKAFSYDESVKQNEWRNFGGYRLVPIPVKNCAENLAGERTNRWPPPVTIGDAPYTAQVKINAEGKETIEVSSQIQNLPVPLFDKKTEKFSKPESEEKLRYKRSLFIDEHSSLVHMTHTLVNEGETTVHRGIMTTSQHISRSGPALQDGENYLAYVPFDTKFKLSDGEQFHITTKPEWRWRFINKNRFPLDKNNPEHVEKYFNTGTNWTGEVAPGIFEVHYDYNLMAGLHIVAAKPWICYVKKNEMTVFAKIFEPYDENLNYEFGANVAVYNSGMETGYLETEVKTAIHTLQPGEHFDFKETQGAAKILSLPVLDINMAGVITKKLSYNRDGNTITGEYGVFHEGVVILQLIDESNHVIDKIILGDFNPQSPIAFKHKILKAVNMTEAQVIIKDVGGEIHFLDQCNIN